MSAEDTPAVSHIEQLSLSVRQQVAGLLQNLHQSERLGDLDDDLLHLLVAIDGGNQAVTDLQMRDRTHRKRRLDGQLREDIDQLEGSCEAARRQHHGVLACDAAAQKLHRTVRRAKVASQCVYEGGLACTVWSDDGHQLALRKRQIDVAQGTESTVAVSNAPCEQQLLRCGHDLLLRSKSFLAVPARPPGAATTITASTTPIHKRQYCVQD